jgi:hypothetical protein
MTQVSFSRRVIMAKRIGLALIGIIWLGTSLAATAAEPLPSLDELLKQYKELGLPLPLKDAKLVRYETHSNGSVGKRTLKNQKLAFQVKPGNWIESPILLYGLDQLSPDDDSDVKDLSPDTDSVKDITQSENDDLFLAIQCQSQGWSKLARYLFERSQKEARRAPKTALIENAWYYWEAKVIEPKIDRAPIAKHLRQMLVLSKDLDTEGNRRLLRSLELALVPSKAKRGSVEALVDDLVDYEGKTGGVLQFFKPDERYFRIAATGFEAVPALIDHLDDDRLTRAMMGGFNNFGSWHLRVGDVISDLLQGLAADQVERDWVRRQVGYRVDKAAIQKWWEEARKLGEETYLLTSVFPGDCEQAEAAVREHILFVIQAKYPRRLESIYKKILDKFPRMNSKEVAAAVSRSNLRIGEKLDLFTYAAKVPGLKHRLSALEEIRFLDMKLFDSLLLDTIESLPSDIKGPYSSCIEGLVILLAIESDNPAVWPALAKVIKRSVVGFRTRLLLDLIPFEEKRHWNDRLRLLASFLGDSTVREIEVNDRDKWFSDFPYRRIEVRDFVAMQMAQMLDVKVDRNPNRTQEQWAKIRAQVQEAVNRELEKSK